MRQSIFGPARITALTASVAALLAALSAGAARADILLGDKVSSVTPSGTGTWIYEYRPFVTEAARVDAGDTFTFYDFNGFVGVVEAPAAWTFSVQNLGPSPISTPFGSVIPNDDAAIPNVTFIYTNGPIVGGPTDLGVFRLESTIGPVTILKPFAATGTDEDTGLGNGNLTSYLAPVPEPGEYAVGGIFAAGLLGLVARARRRSAGAAAA